MATYKEKMQQANREAGASVAAAVIVAVVWAVLGYGLAGSGIVVCSLPLWVVAGCAGTWLVATAASAVLSHFVITDVPFDDEDDAEGEDDSAGIANDAARASATSAGAKPDNETTDDEAVPAHATSADSQPNVNGATAPDACQPTGAARSDSSEA